MTLEEAGRKALDAAENGNLKALEAALKARAAAIPAMIAAPPSEELSARLASAIRGGNALHEKISTLKMRIVTDAARLALLQAGLTAGLAVPPKSHIDCRA